MAEKCSVEGCGGAGEYRVSYLEARVLEEHGYKLRVYHAHPPRRPGVVYLCEEHYRLLKKLRREIEKAERMAMKGA